MNCTTDRSIGYQVTLTSATLPVAATIPDPNGLGNVYSQLDVTNDTNADILISYHTTNGNNNTFIVPASVRVKGRRISSGLLVSTSITIGPVVANTAVSGKVTINAGS